jgi:hypothetical protein
VPTSPRPPTPASAGRARGAPTRRDAADRQPRTAARRMSPAGSGNAA